MTQRAEFQKNVSDYRGQILKVNLFSTLERALLISLFSVTVLVCLDRFDLANYMNWKCISITIVLSFIYSGSFTYFKKKDFQQELIEVDKRFKFNDSISTAYEFHHKNKHHVYLKFIIHDAVKNMKSLDVNDVFPIKVSEFMFLIPVFLILIAALLLFERVDEKITDTTILNPLIKETGLKISEYIEKKKSKPDSTKKDDIHKKANRLSSSFSSENMSLDHALKQLKNLKSDLQNSNEQKITRLETELNTEHTGILNQNNTSQKRPTRKRLKKLNKKISDAFNNKIPVKIKKDLSQVEQDIEFEEFLNMTIESMNQASREEKERELANQEKPPEINDKTTEGENREIDSDSPVKTKNNFGNSPEREDETGENNTNSEVPAGDIYNEKNPEDLMKYIAGKKLSDNSRKDPEDIQSSESDITSDNGLPVPKKEISFTVRALTAMGNSEVSEQQLIKSYKKQVEEVLQKEDIPATHREYIKQYFLSIGFREEEKNGE